MPLDILLLVSIAMRVPTLYRPQNMGNQGFNNLIMKSPKIAAILVALIGLTVSGYAENELTPKKNKRRLTEQKKAQLFYQDSCQFGNCYRGIGAAVNEDGDIYFGKWRKGRPHGLGTIYFNTENVESGIPSGTLLTARFEKGKLDGLATFDVVGSRKFTVYYAQSMDIDAYAELPDAGPMPNFFRLPYSYPWAGRQVRRAYFLDSSYAQNVSLTIHPVSDFNQCFYTNGETNGITIPFLFDTGCSQTALSTEYIEYLRESGVKIKEVGSDVFETACGSIELREFEIDEIRIGDMTFYNVLIAETQSLDNLLGMDLISALGSYTAIPEEHLIILK